jgi:hypothetical protein
MEIPDAGKEVAAADYDSLLRPLFSNTLAGVLPERKKSGREKTVQYIDKNRFA